MNIINSLFWGEGKTDAYFLPTLIARVLQKLTAECGASDCEIYEPYVVKPSKEKFAEQVAEIATKAKGYTFCFIHTDADDINTQEVSKNKVEPARQLLQRLEKNKHCEDVIFIIPVTKIENWLLADVETLREVIGTDLDAAALGLNIGIQQIEQRMGAKTLLQTAVRIAAEARNGNVDINDVFQASANSIELSRLYLLSSFRNFVAELRMALVKKRIVAENCDESMAFS